jgi:hypothetical protein
VWGKEKTSYSFQDLKKLLELWDAEEASKKEREKEKKKEKEREKGKGKRKLKESQKRTSELGSSKKRKISKGHDDEGDLSM